MHSAAVSVRWPGDENAPPGDPEYPVVQEAIVIIEDKTLAAATVADFRAAYPEG